MLVEPVSGHDLNVNFAGSTKNVQISDYSYLFCLVGS